MELKLSDEIKGSLRELKPEAGLLTDRYKSFQKLGIVEPRCKKEMYRRENVRSSIKKRDPGERLKTDFVANFCCQGFVGFKWPMHNLQSGASICCNPVKLNSISFCTGLF